MLNQNDENPSGTGTSDSRRLGERVLEMITGTSGMAATNPEQWLERECYQGHKNPGIRSQIQVEVEIFEFENFDLFGIKYGKIKSEQDI